MKVKVKLLSPVQLCDCMDCRLPGSSVHGSLQARILEWVAIPFSRGYSQPRDQTPSAVLQVDSFTEAPDFSFFFLSFSPIYVFTTLCNMWALSPLTRDQTHAPCIGSAAS